MTSHSDDRPRKFRRILWSHKDDEPSATVWKFLWKLTKAHVDYRLVTHQPGWVVYVDLTSWIRNNLHR